MQFETIAMTIFSLALLLFLFFRRRVITDLQEEIAALGERLHALGNVADRQRNEIEAMMATAQAERRARQMATLGSQPPPKAPPRIFPSVGEAVQARKQEGATRRRFDQSSSANSWENPGQAHAPYQSAAPAPSPAVEPAYSGHGGTFDGGGASGDYDRSESSCSSSSSSSDSGSSGSSDSGGSCGSGD